MNLQVPLENVTARLGWAGGSSSGRCPGHVVPREQSRQGVCRGCPGMGRRGQYSFRLHQPKLIADLVNGAEPA